MKSTVIKPSSPKIKPEYTSGLGWYLVANKNNGKKFFALVNTYGVVYLPDTDTTVDAEFSSKEYFNRTYELLEHYPDATLTVNLKG